MQRVSPTDHLGVFVCWATTFSVVPALASQAGEVVCTACHETVGAALARSVHASAGLECRTCHGGEKRYAVDAPAVARLRQVATQPTDSSQFDHGPTFRGKPSRQEIPERCGTCHADVTVMNPYGLPTDQLAQFRTSGHGRALYEKGDDQVAVCTDCHGRHAVLRPDDPASPVHPRNVPATCERCHGDASVMARSGLSTSVVTEYRQSVHGIGLLEQGDLGMPHCSTCHGSHSAVPPGYRDVGHVCGRCHQTEEQHFLASPHAKFSMFPRCVGCHTRGGENRDHRIEREAASPETICQRCHQQRTQGGHRLFFGELDEQAAQSGAVLYQVIRRAELRYAAVAERVDRVGRGVLLVNDEAMIAEELRTKLVSLAPLQHTLDVEKLTQAALELDTLAEQVNASLDVKVRGLRWRYWALVPMWSFIGVFVAALWIKYKRLKHAMVVEETG